MKTTSRILVGIKLFVLAISVGMAVSCESEEESSTPITPIHHDHPTYTDPEIVTEANISNGAILSAFSVAPGRQVMFSRGNLQYNASSYSWRFAGNQFDTVGRFNAYSEKGYKGWVDLFGWGTSGYGSCAAWMTSTNSNDYAPNINEIAHTDYDWGVRNAISNGGDRSNLWRTLSQEEWNYLLNERNNAIYLRGQAEVMGVGGIVLMPDLWECPDDVSFAPNTRERDKNTYNRHQWIRLQQLGVVFLPAAGYRYGTIVCDVSGYGYYWSSTASHDLGHCLSTNKTTPPDMTFKDRFLGLSVRLVKDI